jgi:tRNA A37 methylthiotransferase MiaB
MKSNASETGTGCLAKVTYFSKDLGGNVYVTTNGCSENRSDCAKMQEFYTINGWSVTSNIREADIILFNACGLTTVREDNSLKVLEEINTQKKSSAEIIVWGCFPKINKERISEIHEGILFDSDESERLEEIFQGNIRARDIHANFLTLSWNGSHQKAKTIKRLSNIFHIQSYIQKRFDKHLWKHASDLVSFVDSDAFFIKICTGCLNACTYCGARLSRGRLKSKPVYRITEEFKEGLKKNFRKFTLIGTDLAAYGRDQDTNLVQLLKALLKNESDYKLRLPNINPRLLIEMMPELRHLFRSGKIEVIGSGVQSGSNRILRLMNRGHSIEDYKDAMSILKTEFPALRLRTNIIIGFPSETEQDFQETVRLLNEVDFTYADIHKYSPRPKTKAVTMPEQIPQEVIEDRYARLLIAFSKHLRETRPDR